MDVAGATSDTADGSEILHQLRSVVYPTIYWVLAPSQVFTYVHISSNSNIDIVSAWK